MKWVILICFLVGINYIQAQIKVIHNQNQRLPDSLELAYEQVINPFEKEKQDIADVAWRLNIFNPGFIGELKAGKHATFSLGPYMNTSINVFWSSLAGGFVYHDLRPAFMVEYREYFDLWHGSGFSGEQLYNNGFYHSLRLALLGPPITSSNPFAYHPGVMGSINWGAQKTYLDNINLNFNIGISVLKYFGYEEWIFIIPSTYIAFGFDVFKKTKTP